MNIFKFVLLLAGLTLAIFAGPGRTDAANLVVTSLADDGGVGELRAAIDQANADTSSDTIVFGDLTGVITLTSALPTITASTSILGPGATVLAVDGAGAYRAFEVSATNTLLTVSGLTVQNCRDTTDGNGGGAFLVEEGALNLIGCTLSANSASSGGAILSNGATTISNCNLTNNIANSSGGALDCLHQANLANCNITGNQAFNGGAICGESDILTVSNCTFSQNASNNRGGAILGVDDIATLTNCTLTDNASAGGGAIQSDSGGTLSLVNCTVSGNTAGDAGGAFVNSGDDVTLANCILYGDYAPSGTEVTDSNGGTTSAICCDIQGGVGPAMGIADSGGNIDSPPLLSPLALNGGPTSTMALAAGSPCLAAGTISVAGVVVPTTDQRGVPRPGHPSIGAYDIPTYILTILGSPFGGLSPSTSISVRAGGSQSVSATPNFGVSFGGWIVDGFAETGQSILADGTALTANGTTLSIGNLQGSHTIQAVFTPIVYTLTPQAGPNGSLMPVLPANVAYAGALAFTAVPAAGYTVSAWSVDGVQVSGSLTLGDGTGVAVSGLTIAFTNVLGSHTIGAAFAPLGPYTLTPQATSNGNISPSSAQTVAYEAGTSFTAVPGTGYTFSAWTVDGSAVTGVSMLGDGTAIAVVGSTLSFSNVQGTHTIGANFTAVTYTLTPQTASNGTLSPATAQTVLFGNSQTFTATPIGGYAFASWTVDGNPVTGVSTLADGTTVTASGATLTFANVQGSHAVGANFTNLTVFLTPQTSANGTLAPGTAEAVALGGSQTFIAVPALGYSITAWSVNSAVVTGVTTLPDGTTVTVTGSTLTFNNARGGHTVAATFSVTTFSLSPQGDPNGTISPSSVQNVNYAGTQAFTANPATGYGLGGWSVDGRMVTTSGVLADGTNYAVSGSTLTFSNVLGSHLIAPMFMTLMYTLSPQAPIGGSISPDTATGLPYLQSQTFTADAAPGYMFSNWTVNGTAVSGTTTLSDGTTVAVSGANLTFSAVQGSHMVAAVFEVHTFAPGLAMISVPTDYSDTPLDSVLGYASPKLAAWNPVAGSYAVTPTIPADRLRVGQGYWVSFPQAVTISVLGAAPTYPLNISLAKGWNLIGCPQSTELPVSSMRIGIGTSISYTFSAAVTRTLVQATLYTWQSGDSAYEIVSSASGSLTPYEGYWLYANQPCTLIVPTPG